jgi:uncharacterized protein
VTPARPRVWTVFVAYVAAVGAALLASLLAVIAWAASRGGQVDEATIVRLADSLAVIVLAATLTSAALAGTALLGARLSPEPLAARLRLRPVRVPLATVVAMVVGALAVSECAGVAVQVSGLGEGGALKTMSDAFRSVSGGWLVLAAVWLGTLPGLCEELFFRGYMQTRLSRRWGAWWGIAVTSLAFGLLHADVAHTPVTFVIGFYLGWITERAGTIVVAIFAHVVNNVVAVLAASLLQESPVAGLVILLVSVVALPVCLLVIRRTPMVAELHVPDATAAAGIEAAR